MLQKCLIPSSIAQRLASGSKHPAVLSCNCYSAFYQLEMSEITSGLSHNSSSWGEGFCRHLEAYAAYTGAWHKDFFRLKTIWDSVGQRYMVEMAASEFSSRRCSFSEHRQGAPCQTLRNQHEGGQRSRVPTCSLATSY